MLDVSGVFPLHTNYEKQEKSSNRLQDREMNN